MRRLARTGGRPCPDGEAHGGLLVLDDRLYCPHAEHDRTGTPRFFDMEGNPLPRKGRHHK